MTRNFQADINSECPTIGYTVTDNELVSGSAPESTSFLIKRIKHFFPDAVEITDAQPENINLLIEFSAFNPIIDERSLYKMIETSWATKNNYFPVDDIPGTAPTRISIPSKNSDEVFPFFYNTQPNYCTNFNVKRPSRAHIFKKLIQKKPLSQQTLLTIFLLTLKQMKSSTLSFRMGKTCRFRNI